MSRPVRSTRNPNPIYNPYARGPRSKVFSSVYEPKPRASAYGDVDGYDSDASSSCELCGEGFGHKMIVGLNNKRYCCDDCMDQDNNDDDDNSDCSSNCSIHDVTKEEVIGWLIEDGLMMQDEAPVRRSARIARRVQKFGPVSYVGMDSIEPEDEFDGITNIWYDTSLGYDSDYELPEEKKMREKEERRQKMIKNFVARRQAKWAKQEERELRKSARLAKKKQIDIEKQIANLTI